jgi:hypothetical protein
MSSRWRRMMRGLACALALALLSSWLFMGWEHAYRPVGRLSDALFAAMGAAAFLWATWEGWRASRK